MGQSTCTVEGCDRKSRARGWCDTHYKRWKRSAENPNPCTIEGCDRPHAARGLCETHYNRWLRHGTTDERDRGTISYQGAHSKVTRLRGRAAEQQCIQCGDQAEEWAYQGTDPDELISDPALHHFDRPGLRYSANPDHYAPMCIPCHRALDKAVRKASA